MRRTWIARKLGLDGNPLRRRTDRIAACAAIMLLAVFLIGAPFLSVAAVGWAGRPAAAELRAERSRHQVPAILLQAAPKSAATGGGLLGYSLVLARWTAPDGQARTGRIPVSTSMAAGRTVRLWVNAAGSPAGPPLNHRLVPALEATAAVIATVALGIMLLCLAWAGRGCLTGASAPAGRRHGPLSAPSGPGASGRGASRGREQTTPVMRGRPKMTSDQAMRASDRRDRERAAEVPCGAYAAGCLDLEEFYDRAGAAYSAKTWGELRDLTADLPAGQILGQAEHDADSRAAPARPGHAPQRPFAFIWVMAVIWLAIGRRCRTPPSPAARRPGRRRPLGGGAHEHSNDPGSESNWQGTSRFPGITVGPASRDRPPASGRPAAIFRPGPVAAQAFGPRP